MNWHFCIDSAEKRALDRCGFMNKGSGYGAGNPASDGRIFGLGYGDGYTHLYGDCAGGSEIGHENENGVGYGWSGGNGCSATKW